MVITVQYGKAFWRKLEGSDNQSRDGKEGGRRKDGGERDWFILASSGGRKADGAGKQREAGNPFAHTITGLGSGQWDHRGFHLSSLQALQILIY